MSRFFVDRPIVAIVISILTVVLGLVAVTGLPIAQFPSIIPPQIQIQATYTGADAVTIEQSVATPIEQQMNGVDKMLYMQSTNANDGTMTLVVTFDVESDVNIDQVNAQNRVAQAAAQPAHRGQPVRHHLPLDRRPAARGDLALLAERHLRLALPRQLRAHQRQRRALPRARRRPGGELRALRVRDAHLGEARPAGEARPDRAGPGARRAAAEHGQPGRTRGRRAGAARPAAHVHRARAGPAGDGRGVRERGAARVADGSEVRLKDVARIELGALTYNQSGRFNGRPAALIAVFQTPGANALHGGGRRRAGRWRS